MPFLTYSEENIYPEDKVLTFLGQEQGSALEEWTGIIKASLSILVERHGQCLLLAPLLQKPYFHLFFFF